MWYDKRSMSALFYIGVMVTLIGVGIWKLEYELPGVLLTILGVVLLVLGFWGIKMNTLVEDRFRRRQRKV